MMATMWHFSTPANNISEITDDDELLVELNLLWRDLPISCVCQLFIKEFHDDDDDK